MKGGIAESKTVKAGTVNARGRAVLELALSIYLILDKVDTSTKYLYLVKRELITRLGKEAPG